MKFEALKTLIDEFEKLPFREKKEENIFTIGARGHYENPVSDLLAFFINPSAAHPFKDKVLQALFNCIKEESEEQFDIVDTNLVASPQREQVTDNSKRIDLLLESENWVMLIENKIYHYLDNPLDTYTAWAERTYESKEKIFLVLSIEGTKSENWIGVSWKQFLDEIKKVMADTFLFGELNKWHVLLREYILHLESLVNPFEHTEMEKKFVFDNLLKIKEIISLKKSVIDVFQKEVRVGLEKKFGPEITTRMEEWDGFPALRFSLNTWKSESDLVLCLDDVNSKKFYINIYIHTENEDSTNKAKKIMPDIPSKQESYKGVNFIRFRFDLPSFERSTLISEVTKKMELLDAYEKQNHPDVTIQK